MQPTKFVHFVHVMKVHFKRGSRPVAKKIVAREIGFVIDKDDLAADAA